jgi:hypothetical protein
VVSCKAARREVWVESDLAGTDDIVAQARFVLRDDGVPAIAELRFLTPYAWNFDDPGVGIGIRDLRRFKIGDMLQAAWKLFY